MKDKETIKVIQENTENVFVELIEVMQAVDTGSPEAELNETTISDGKGGRILL